SPRAKRWKPDPCGGATGHIARSTALPAEEARRAFHQVTILAPAVFPCFASVHRNLYMSHPRARLRKTSRLRESISRKTPVYLFPTAFFERHDHCSREVSEDCKDLSRGTEYNTAG